MIVKFVKIIASHAYLLMIFFNSTQCTKIDKYTSPIVNEVPMKITYQVTDTSAENISDGKIEISVSGGAPPYTYFWSTGAITKNIANCPAGTYTVRVEDSKKATLTVSIVIKTLTIQTNPLKILFVGNSLTGSNNMPDMFENFASLNGKKVEVTKYLIYGPSFRAYYTQENFNNILIAKQWDYIFLQSDDLVASEDYRIKELNALTHVKNLIKSYNNNTKILYFMCWTMPSGYFNFSYEELYQHIFDGMIFVTRQYDFGIVPVGRAWYLTTDTSRRNALYESDGWHPTMTGSYLYACVLYVSIFKESIQNTSYSSSLSEGDAAYFRRLASETVLENLTLWNLD